MFSVAGTETVPNGWSKRMEAVKADGVKFDIVYRMRAYEYGDRPVRLFIWRNAAGFPPPLQKQPERHQAHGN